MEFMKLFNVMLIVIPVIALAIFALTIFLFVSPKFRAKFMGQNIKAAKYMLEDNEKDLEYIVNKKADISRDGIIKTTRAIKEGFSSDTIYCKYCGSLIEKDSKFCKNCGKKII